MDSTWPAQRRFGLQRTAPGPLAQPQIRAPARLSMRLPLHPLNILKVWDSLGDLDDLAMSKNGGYPKIPTSIYFNGEVMINNPLKVGLSGNNDSKHNDGFGASVLCTTA